MTRPVATLAAFIDLLDAADPETPVVFATQNGALGPGYHVTELKLAQINSIDCGGNHAGWTETQLQLLDGSMGKHLTAGKVASILRRSAHSVDGLSSAALWIEMAPRNQGLSRYRVNGLQADGKSVRVDLIEGRAQCKPAVAMGCCG